VTVAISFDHVSKAYRRGHAPSFREDTVQWAGRLRGKRGDGNVVRALSDVSFEVEEGGSFALMGANGSGKTTALKLISRVTYPTRGAVQVRGRIGALIEVGTGLHPELTGRENVWLYGRILGLNKEAISKRFDSIVEFADLGMAIDQPVKQYSSGMHLRLGFSLAAHLEPDVLLIDEAVSVGDTGFQRRCLERMTELNASGATLVFVSHATSMVTALCSTGVLLREGRVAGAGKINDISAQYLNEMASREEEGVSVDAPLELLSWDYEFSHGRNGSPEGLSVLIHVRVPTATRDPRFGVAISHPRAGALIGCSMMFDGYSVGTVEGDVTVRCDIDRVPLQRGSYQLWAMAYDEGDNRYLMPPRLLGEIPLGTPTAFNTRELDFVGTRTLPIVQAPYRWSITRAADNMPSSRMPRAAEPTPEPQS